MIEEVPGLPPVEVFEQAALRQYNELAQTDPVLHEFAEEVSREEALAFKEVLGETFPLCAVRIRLGLYRIFMDFCDKPPYDNETEVSMVHGDTIIRAFNFLAGIYQGDWEKTSLEFSLLPVSMHIISQTADIPKFESHDARFGFLFAMMLENGTVTGLRREKD